MQKSRNAEPTFDDVLVAALERVIDRKLDRIANAVKPRMMSLKQARVYLDVGDTTIRQMIADGTLTPVQYKDGGAIYIEREQLDRFIDERKVLS